MEQIETKRKLMEWIKNTTDCFVYTDSKQTGGDGLFVVKGTSGAKPDFVITKLIDGYKWNIAVEVKPGVTRQLTDAMFQCVRYAGQYLNEDAKYYVQGEQLKIHVFCVATANSELGFLYDKEKELGPESFVKGDFLNFPEKPMTYNYWRILFRLWKNSIKEYLEKTSEYTKKPPKIGILVAELKEGRLGVMNDKEPVIIANNQKMSFN